MGGTFGGSPECVAGVLVDDGGLHLGGLTGVAVDGDADDAEGGEEEG